ncbi:dTDP-4-amino-4,6-dideoxygalactose transaminase [Pseudomonas cavernae]|uniref:dTDP-4-amino-4,6-dideoxygalactose transaminase n=1 Tax=Pseudomonas cavernae TaxID=2320867 RepID=A0A385Z3F6_9PSED|nr:dTDP-4-amino-4,6-dideoxygalactose transaminase [Pseudomonas cavernae]AYC33294.1 dTDP-4-amino-4,6-dideoxygalactose transaminase [Pseudomonas cavernae]
MIAFNKPPYTGNEDKYVMAAMRSSKMSGDGQYTHLCQEWFEKQTGCKKALLTPSCTQALEMAAILLDIQPGDEVIMPSYTFVSTANAFALRGAKIVFVDIRPDTMNIDENLIEAAITPKTKAIVPVHYAGVACEMDTIMAIADRHQLFVIEDAAQGMLATYKGRPLGSIGHMGAYSFHETKNYTSGGEGGLLLISDERFVVRAEIIREKGTNRSQFFRGMIDKYTWVDIGSSYLASELQAAYLYGQLERAEEININRLKTWSAYKSAFSTLTDKIETPHIPSDCQHNSHMFYLKLSGLESRTRFLEAMSKESVMAVFHYVPLHSSSAGKKLGVFSGTDNFTTKESERLVRLPLWFGMEMADIDKIVSSVTRSVYL